MMKKNPNSLIILTWNWKIDFSKVLLARQLIIYKANIEKENSSYPHWNYNKKNLINFFVLMGIEWKYYKVLQI